MRQLSILAYYPELDVVRNSGWFRTKSFEKGGRVYELLGVRQYKKGLIKALRFFGRKRENELNGTNYFVGEDLSAKSLEEYDSETRNNELLHTLGFIGGTALSYGYLSQVQNKWGALAWCATAIPWTLNELAIVLTQRYNRARIYSILERKKAKAVNTG